MQFICHVYLIKMFKMGAKKRAVKGGDNGSFRVFIS